MTLICLALSFSFVLPAVRNSGKDKSIGPSYLADESLGKEGNWGVRRGSA